MLPARPSLVPPSSYPHHRGLSSLLSIYPYKFMLHNSRSSFPFHHSNVLSILCTHSAPRALTCIQRTCICLVFLMQIANSNRERYVRTRGCTDVFAAVPACYLFFFPFRKLNYHKKHRFIIFIRNF